MSPRIVFIMVMLGLLLVANILMLSGFTNYPSTEGFADYMANTPSEETEEGFLGSAPSGDKYEAIGAYDNVVKKPAHGLSNWRGPAPNEPLLGPDVEVGPDNLFIFKNNQCKPECCGASYSCGGGCVCTTAAQRDLISSRGGNRTGPVDL